MNERKMRRREVEVVTTGKRGQRRAAVVGQLPGGEAPAAPKGKG